MRSASLYIHMPWCVQKCPYCDFNSHKSPTDLPEKQYILALLDDLKMDVSQFLPRKVQSIFIGGGTPSLFSAKAYETLFNGIQSILPFSNDIEITMEANPGTFEQQRFHDYRALGVNRLSLGVQSFNPHHLKSLGRIHDEKQAIRAIEQARLAGFDNINIDIMHGLPNQTIQEGLLDLQTGIHLQPDHLSWYQLTIEPNTMFYKNKPTLPNEDDCCTLEEEGLQLLAASNYKRYEISAFATNNHQCAHNLNYWRFGDYFGIGAGAHGKLTLNQQHYRTQKHRQPRDYLNPNKAFLADTKILATNDLIFEFMLNATRLEESIPFNLFTEQTGLSIHLLAPMLHQAAAKKLLVISDNTWQVTPLGRRYTNDLQTLFL